MFTLFWGKMLNKKTPENAKEVLAAFLEWYRDLYGNEWFVKNHLADAPVEKLSHGTRDQSGFRQTKRTSDN